MPTPKSGYYVNGKRVPGVSTILSRFKASGALIHWAFNIPYQGLIEARDVLSHTLDTGDHSRALEFLEHPLENWDYRKVRDTAADAGTCAHAMMEAHIKNDHFDPGPYSTVVINMAYPAFQAFVSWSKQVKFKVIETEVPLTSKKHLFGGTRDAILIDDQRALGDWKTAGDIYPENLCQLGAYGILDEEAGGEVPGGYHILRFNKQKKPDDPVMFTHKYWSQLDKAKVAFLKMRELYELMKDIEGFAK